MTAETTAPDPREAAKEALAFLEKHADEARVETLQRYFKDPIEAFGVDYAIYKNWNKGFLAPLKKRWVLHDAVLFCHAMVEDPRMEARSTGFLVVAAFVKEGGPDLLAHVLGWLEGSCGNWGLVDNLAPSVLSPLLKKHPELVPEVKGWTSSPNQWVRRGAAVAFVSLVKEEEFQAPAYEIATALLADKEDLIHKAVGWMLREAGKVDRDRLEKYLLQAGPRLPRTTLRYAIEKFPKEDRKRLLEATKG